jgi:DeoR/GlpR family transcriptional regulator of sugar metabolism
MATIDGVMTHSRDELVMDVLRSSGNTSVAELADTLDVAEATGGATVTTAPSATVSADPLLPQKRAIGAAAAGLIEDGSTVALSSGSTVLELARRLRDRRLTVITNALDVANALLDVPGIELVVLGGVVLPGVHSLRGHLTEDAIRDLRADTVFMGASAIDLDHGFMTEHIREIAVDRALRRMARDAVILADASKFDRVAPGFMFGFEQVGTLVTDERVRPPFIEALAARGTRVVVGKEGAQGTAR